MVDTPSQDSLEHLSADSIGTSSYSLEQTICSKMRVLYFSNESPSDDMRDLMRRLYLHSKDKRHPLLAKFIHEATEAVREEVRNLPNTLRLLVSPFDNVFDLAHHSELHTGPLGGAVTGMLLCVLQLANVIG
jgi:hypothetical protein